MHRIKDRHDPRKSRFILSSCQKKYIGMRYKRKELDAVQVGQGLLLCEEGRQRVHRLNKTSAAVWKLCDGEKGASEIAANLAREFGGASAKEIEADVLATLSEMTKLGIVNGCG